MGIIISNIIIPIKNILISPIYQIYIHGPSLQGFGFWEGKHNYDICAELTNVSSEFWYNHSNECLLLIEKKFNSFCITILCITYSYVCVITMRHGIQLLLHKVFPLQDTRTIIAVDTNKYLKIN